MEQPPKQSPEGWRSTSHVCPTHLFHVQNNKTSYVIQKRETGEKKRMRSERRTGILCWMHQYGWRLPVWARLLPVRTTFLDVINTICSHRPLCVGGKEGCHTHTGVHPNGTWQKWRQMGCRNGPQCAGCSPNTRDWDLAEGSFHSRSQPTKHPQESSQLL